MRANKDRAGCVDVFKSFLYERANYAGKYEIPIIPSLNNIEKPKRIVKAKYDKKYDKWIAFYEDDVKFECFWNNPKRYLNILSRAEGIICPDFSLYRDMPLNMQIWNINRSRILGHWLSKKGFKVVPNVRWSDERTYKIACAGIKKGSTIAISTHGSMKIKNEKELFKRGLEYVISHIEPKQIIVYGTAPEEVFRKYKLRGIEIFSYKSEISNYHTLL